MIFTEDSIGNWISVDGELEPELPEVGVDVLTAYRPRKPDMSGQLRVGINRRLDGGMRKVMYTDDNGFPNHNHTYFWQALPEAPKRPIMKDYKMKL